MNEESNDYPLVPVILGVSTTLICIALGMHYHWLSQLIPSVNMFVVVGFVFALGLGYYTYAISKQNEQYREHLEGMEYKLSEIEVAREVAEHNRRRVKELLDAVSYSVSGIMFRFEVPGFKEHGQFRYIGDAIASVTGHCAEDILEQSKLFWDMIHPKDLEAFTTSLNAAVDAQVVWEHEFRMVTQAGDTKWFRIRALPNDCRERPFCFDGVIFDETEQRTAATVSYSPGEDVANDLHSALEREASRADEMTHQFEKSRLENEDLIRSFSHEVRTTVNGVQGMLEMLLEKQLNQEQRECVIEVRNTVRSLLPVVGHLIDHNYLRAGELQLEHAPFNPKSLLQETVAMFEAEAKRDNIKLETVFDEQIPEMLEGDAARVRQVLFSLLSNAIHYTSTGTITTEFFCSGRAGKYTFVRFHVRDTGRGMTGDIKAKFFKNSVVLNHEKSKALGLPLCRNLVEQMGGKLAVKSKEGSGSDVYFVLRLKDVSERFIEASSPVDDAEWFQPLHLLAAEDVLVNQRVCKYRIEALGHQISIVNNGKEALEALEHNAFDAVLMDCEMPIMDGFAATEAIRNQAHPVQNPDIYIVAVTARSDRGSILESGMNEYLSKPFNQEELEGAIHRIASYIREKGFGFVLPKQQIVDDTDQVFARNAIPTNASQRSRDAESFDNLGSRISKGEMDALLALTQGKKG